MNSFKDLLKQDPEVEFPETPSRKSALTGFVLGFVGYMYVLPPFLFTLFVKIFNLNKSTPENIQLKYSLLAQLLGGIIILIIMICFVSRNEVKNMIKNFNGNTVFLGLKYFLISYVLVVLWNIIFTLFGGTMGDSSNEQGVNSMMMASPILAACLTCIVAPLIEELIFRFYLYKGVEPQNPIVALFLSAFLFAFVHLFASIDSGTFLEDLKTFPGYFLPSLVMSYAYFKHRKFGVNLVCHMANNIFATIVTYLQPVISGGTNAGGEIVEGVIKCLIG